MAEKLLQKSPKDVTHFSVFFDYQAFAVSNGTEAHLTVTCTLKPLFCRKFCTEIATEQQLLTFFPIYRLTFLLFLNDREGSFFSLIFAPELFRCGLDGRVRSCLGAFTGWRSTSG